MSASNDPLYLDNCVEGSARSHQRLLVMLDGVLELDDPEGWFSAPSALVDWSRRHVIAHLARNAESHVHLFAEAEAGREGDQYPGGAAARAAGIESYLALDASTLVARNRAAIYALEAALCYVEMVGVAAIAGHADPLVIRAAEGLVERGLELLCPVEACRPGGILAFRHQESTRLHELLERESIRVMHHAGRIRIAIHGYNTADDVDRLLDAISRWLADVRPTAAR